MGSQAFTNYSRGKDVKDAYNRAVEAAEEEYGHQEGYSGEINSSAGFRDVTKEWKASKMSIDKFIETANRQAYKAPWCSSYMYRRA